jgi:glycosyltransferase involved in cell wall biosynthesis
MKENNKIFLFTDWYEPGYKAGGPIQSCKNLVALLKEKYRFFIFCSDRDLGDQGPYENIAVDRWIEKDQQVRVWYASPSSLNRKTIKVLLEEVDPGTIYFNSMYSLKFSILPLWILIKKGFEGRMILAPRGMLHKGALQKKFLKKYFFLKVFRYAGWYKKIIFHATDGQEKKDILFFFTEEAKVILAKDTPHPFSQPRPEKRKMTGVLECIFISRIHPKKNLDYILNRLAETNKTLEFHLDIYGAEDDAAYSKQCREIAGRLRSNIVTRFMGSVPYEKVLDTMGCYHLFVLATKGENFGHAVFESLSVGTPVLISDQTPWRGLEEKKAGWDLPLEKPELFSLVLEQAARFDQEAYDEWSQQAWAFANAYINQGNLKEEYLKLFS